MEFKGTQGEWLTKEVFNDKGSYHKVMCDNENSVCNVTTRNQQQAKANSLLISKAPELLEALKHTLEIMYQCNPPIELHEIYANAFANYNNLIEEATEL